MRMAPAMVALAMLWAVGCGTAPGDGARGRPPVAPTGAIPPFPPNFDYPANPAVLTQAIDRGDVALLRRHGWYLWAGLNTLDAAGRPIWWDWPTSSQAFPYESPPPQAAALPSGTPPPAAASRPRKGLRAKNAANTPINLPAPWYPPPVVTAGACATGSSREGLPDGERFQSNGDIMVAGVIYDADAYGWIQQSNLADARQLTTLWKQGQRQIAPFPSRSIVLKPMYWPAKGDDLTALPVWDPADWPVSYPDYVGYERWKRIVVIEPSGKPVPAGMTAVSRYLFHVFESDQKTPLGPFLKTGRVVSINDFYHQRIDAATLAAFSPGDRAILDASACWLYNRPFRAGDLLVSVAMHVITKEIPSWTLQSLWWHDRPNAGPYAKDRPDIPPALAPGPWRHYLLTIEYGIESGPGLLPVSFNPYIELAAAHPIATNCRNCHRRAAWPRGGAVTPPPRATASYLAAGGPGALADLQSDNPVFNGLMLLDFQWAVSDRAGAPPQPR